MESSALFEVEDNETVLDTGVAEVDVMLEDFLMLKSNFDGES